MKKTILLSLLAAIILFFWGFVSWAILPWHNDVANKFTDEAAVSAVLKANSPQAGVYFLPFSQQDYGPGKVAAFANVHPNGMEMNMGKQMGISMVTQFLSALLVLTLLSGRQHLGYLPRIGLFALAGLTISFVSHAPYWNWFGFSTPYVLVIIADTIIGWTLVALILGKWMQKSA